MTESAIYELRRYRLKPGHRDTLIELFERRFIETQEETGMMVEAIYRDSDDAEAFVWVRSFADMASRAAALQAFYTGPAWQSFGPAANAAMINSDNVLLLRPAGSDRPFATSAGAGEPGRVTVSVASLAPGREAAFAALFATEARPILERSGARIDATFVTERSENSFPRLPVREGETVFAWVSAFRDDAAHRASRERLERDEEWTSRVFPRLDEQVWRLETARLEPTGRSRHRW